MLLRCLQGPAVRPLLRSSSSTTYKACGNAICCLILRNPQFHRTAGGLFSCKDTHVSGQGRSNSVSFVNCRQNRSEHLQFGVVWRVCRILTFRQRCEQLLYLCVAATAAAAQCGARLCWWSYLLLPSSPNNSRISEAPSICSVATGT